jgi:hypothetical protein
LRPAVEFPTAATEQRQISLNTATSCHHIFTPSTTPRQKEPIVCPGECEQRPVISVTLLQRSVAVRLDENTMFSVIDGPKENRSMFCNESDIALKLIKRARS